VAIAVDDLAIGGNKAIVANGYFLECVNTRSVDSCIISNDDFRARSVRHDFASGEHVDVVVAVIGIDGHIITNDESSIFVHLHKRHFFEFHFFPNRDIRAIE
jgi:hypothetical protein